MPTYKHLLLVLFAVQLMSAFSQTQKQDTYGYDALMAANDYKRGLQLEHADSLKEAMRHFRYVAKYRQGTAMGKMAIQKLDTLWEIEKNKFVQQLSGKWRWIWSGSNWGTSDSPKGCQCERYWLFNGNQIEVIEGGDVRETIHFEIVKDLEYMGVLPLYLLKIEGSDEIWRVEMYHETDNAYFLSERSKDAEWFLSLNLDFNCVCGCAEKRFERAKN